MVQSFLIFTDKSRL